MTENKPITNIINIILDDLNQKIKNIGEKCLNFQEENKNLKEQLARKTKECEELKERFKKFHDRKLDESADLLCKLHKEECLKFKAEQKLERIKEIAEYEFKELMNAEDYHNMTEVLKQILQIIDEVE